MNTLDRTLIFCVLGLGGEDDAVLTFKQAIKLNGMCGAKMKGLKKKAL